MKRNFFCKFFSILLLCIFLPAATYSADKGRVIVNFIKRIFPDETTRRMIAVQSARHIEKKYREKKITEKNNTEEDESHTFTIIIIILGVIFFVYLVTKQPQQQKKEK